MTRCSTGRATQKYRGNGTDLSDILETPGDIIYADAAVSAENLVISGTTGDVLKVSASGIPEWGTSTSQWITSGDDISYSLGHVGIGTTSPDANLHVTGNTFVSTDLALGGTLTMGNVLVEALHELSAITATGNVTPHVIEFTNPTTGLVTTGNVGIKTSTPGYTLDVTGDINFTGALTQNGSTFGSSPWVTSGNDISYTTGRVGVGASTPDRDFHVVGTSRFDGEVEWYKVGQRTSHANYGTNRDWYIRSGGYFGKVVIQDGGGNVGIGTSSPQGNLHVSAGSAGDCRLILEADTDNNNEGDNPRIEFWQDGSIQESAIGMTSNRLNLWNSVSSGGGIAFHTNTVDGWTNAIERMTITSAGNVGINQTSPNYTLDVIGNINFTGALTQNGSVYGGGGSGSSPWVISGNDISYTTGRVGIGTSSPETDLHVAGDLLVDVQRTFQPTDTHQQQQKIQASDAQASDTFGYSVSLSSDGNTALVGAYLEDTGGTDAGAAYVFTRSNGVWSQQQKIQASDAQQSDLFGCSVSLSGDGNTALVGAYDEDAGGTGAGAAYVFTRSNGTWSQQQKIQASDPQAYDYFGYSVSLSSDGNTALVGAYNEAIGTTSAGAAYVFTRSNGFAWTQQQKIKASDAQQSDFFGRSVSLSGDGNTALVGAYNEDTGGTDAGAAYVFTHSNGTWTQQQKIQASATQQYEYFGSSVSLSSDGNTALVGARGTIGFDGYTLTGAAYVFTRSNGTWSQQQKIQASDAQYNDRFGRRVSLSSDGNTALVGAYFEDTGGTDAGAAYVFTRSNGTWTQNQKIQASDAQASDYFGSSVSLSGDGNTALVGAYLEDTGGTNAGAVYIFSGPTSGPRLFVDGSLGNVGIGTANPSVELHISGTGAIIVPSGTTAERPGTLVTGMIRYNTTSLKYEGYGLYSWLDLSIADPPELYSFTSHTFTPCNGDSRYGPQLSDALSTYGNISPWNNTNFFNIVTRGFQLWTVPKTGTYRITARGARGGEASSSYAPYITTPGSGGSVRADIALTINTQVVFIVGQTPPESIGDFRSGSGGGATWVLKPGAYTNNDDVYMVAGGGGGAGPRHYNSGTAGHADASSQGTLGVGGTSHWNSNGGGAGWTADGDPAGARGGVRPAGGAMGGTGTTHGGFGGGGSESGDSAAGGAGATGGRAALRYNSTGSDTARGGTSYITTNATNRSFLGTHGLTNGGNVHVELLS